MVLSVKTRLRARGFLSAATSLVKESIEPVRRMMLAHLEDLKRRQRLSKEASREERRRLKNELLRATQYHKILLRRQRFKAKEDLRSL